MTNQTTTQLETVANPLDAAGLPGFFTLKDGTKMIQTSGHAATFSDGTCFKPDEIESKAIQAYWRFLQVDRKFESVPSVIPGIKLSHSSQSISEANLNRLHEITAANPDTAVLVSFMVVSALNEMGIRDQFPTVIAGNATPETSRAKPDEKIWDLANMAY